MYKSTPYNDFGYELRTGHHHMSNLYYEHEYFNGVQHGISREWFDKLGQLSSEVQYVCGSIKGREMWYSRNGKACIIRYTLNSEPVGECLDIYIDEETRVVGRDKYL